MFSKKIINFRSFGGAKVIFLAIIIFFGAQSNVYSATAGRPKIVVSPTMYCLGGCPADNLSPTSIGNPTPAVGSAEITPTPIYSSPTPAAITQTTGITAPTSAPCQPVLYSANNVMHAKAAARGTRHSSVDDGLIKKIIELFQAMLKLIEQLMQTAGIIPNNPTNQTQTSASNNTASNSTTSGGNTYGNSTNPAVSLPPCPTNTPMAQGQGQNTNQNTGTQSALTGGGANAGENGNKGNDCNAAAVPEQAKIFGITKLTFCEDFSSPETFDLDGKPVEGKTKFTQARPGNISDSQPMPASAWVWNADGTLSVNPTRNNNKINAISSWTTDHRPKGFLVKGNTKGWYIEARLKHNANKVESGHFALWTMAACKLYGGCVTPIEVDFYEYIKGRVTNTIRWYPVVGSLDWSPVIGSCDNEPNSDRTKFFTTGALFMPGNETVRFYNNDQKTCEKTKEYFPHLSDMADMDFPIIFGAGPDQPYTLDYIRVWEK